jgi:hypothetical protein
MIMIGNRIMASAQTGEGQFNPDNVVLKVGLSVETGKRVLRVAL